MGQRRGPWLLVGLLVLLGSLTLPTALAVPQTAAGSPPTPTPSSSTMPPTPEVTPTYQVFIPGAGGGESQDSTSSRIETYLVRYGSLILLALALIAWLLLRRSRKREQEG
ncbi:MAG: hypothetical protein ACP5GX_04320 [Anaerolineae bacterium]